MNGFSRIAGVDIVRSIMLKRWLVRIRPLPNPPKFISQNFQYTGACNLSIRSLKSSHVKLPDVPASTNHGWGLSDGKLEPVWSGGPILPSRWMGILSVGDTDYEQDADQEGPDVENTFSSCEDSNN